MRILNSREIWDSLERLEQARDRLLMLQFQSNMSHLKRALNNLQEMINTSESTLRKEKEEKVVKKRVEEDIIVIHADEDGEPLELGENIEEESEAEWGERETTQEHDEIVEEEKTKEALAEDVEVMEIEVIKGLVDESSLKFDKTMECLEKGEIVISEHGVAEASCSEIGVVHKEILFFDVDYSFSNLFKIRGRIFFKKGGLIRGRMSQFRGSIAIIKDYGPDRDKHKQNGPTWAKRATIKDLSGNGRRVWMIAWALSKQRLQFAHNWQPRPQFVF